MPKLCLLFGSIAGLVVGVPLFVETAAHIDVPYPMLVGYLTMLIALSAVFAAIKRHRDRNLGGVIRFWPALGLGLGISIVAGIFYVAAWEAALAVTHFDFADAYAKAQVAHAGAAERQRVAAEMDEFRRHYANPFYRLAITFSEIFPVGVLVSLISAGLLRSSRFLPARRALVLPLLLLALPALAEPRILYVGAISIEPCQDASILAEWYGRLGIQTKEIQGGFYKQIDTAAGPVFFGIHPRKASAPRQCQPGMSVVFAVEDYAASLEAARSKGLTPDSTETDEQGRFAHFRDPDGNQVTLWGK